VSERRRILVADDNEHNREYARQVLCDGWDVSLAGDGLAAVDAVRRERPDLVLLDLSMPGLDGWEVARRLKADPAAAATVLVACTAHAMSGDRASALEAGCDDYLAKPFRPDELLAVVERHVGPGVSTGDDEWALDDDLSFDDEEEPV